MHGNATSISRRSKKRWLRMLNVKVLLAKILSSPFIIERGTSGIWTYQKWPNHEVEMWGTASRSGSFANNAHHNITVAFPSFIDQSGATIVGSGGGTAQPNAFLAYTNEYNLSSGRGIDAYIRNNGGATINGSIWARFYVRAHWGGYCITGLLSTIERWWRYVECKGSYPESSPVAVSANNTHCICHSEYHIGGERHIHQRKRRCLSVHTKWSQIACGSAESEWSELCVFLPVRKVGRHDSSNSNKKHLWFTINNKSNVRDTDNQRAVTISERGWAYA